MTDVAPNKRKEVKWPPFNPFVRHPTSNLGKMKILITGPILIPIRAIGAIVTLSLALIWANVASIGSDPSKPYSPARQRWFIGGCRVFARILLFFYGYVWINETHEVEPSASSPAPVVVCNHVGFVELLFLVAKYGCCFVSKEENRKVPAIGKVSEVMQSIFVSRGDNRGPGGRTVSTTEKILERLRAPAGQWPPLAICPEGTTTTGHVMIHMHTSAFLAGTPIQPVVFRLPFSPVYGYDPTFSCANMYLHILGLMAQPMNHLHVTHMAVYTPTKAEEGDAKLYANNVRTRMADVLGVETYELQWMHKLQFELKAKQQEMGRRLLADRNGGVVPNPPVFTQDAFGRPLESAKDK